MIKSIIKLAFLLVIGLLGYNYFLGTEAEKDGVRKIGSETKEVFRSIGDLLRTERDKMREGKYDDAFDKISDAFQNLKDRVKTGSEYADKLKELEKEKDVLVEKYKEANENGLTEKGEKKVLRERIEKLVGDMENVTTAIDKENEGIKE